MFVCPSCGVSAAAPGACADDGSPLRAADDARLGSIIGSYRLARTLGAGGMGTVYLGFHPTIGSRVAIKVLAPECAAHADSVRRFFDEARAVNLIQHEGIVSILDLAHLDDGTPYILMEFLDGESLADRIERQGPLPEREAIRVACEVLDALAAAHENGIVHRDIKPDNIFLLASGRIKVLDFGVAKLFDRGVTTQLGTLIGTPHYMAPEQACALPISYATDLYAVAVVLFEMLAGEPPFDGERLTDIIRLQIDGVPPPLAERCHGVDGRLVAAVMCGLEKDPQDRFASAQAFQRALLDIVGVTSLRAFSVADPEAAPSSEMAPTQRRPATLAGVTQRDPATLAGVTQRHHVDQQTTLRSADAQPGARATPSWRVLALGAALLTLAAASAIGTAALVGSDAPPARSARDDDDDRKSRRQTDDDGRIAHDPRDHARTAAPSNEGVTGLWGARTVHERWPRCAYSWKRSDLVPRSTR